MVGATGMERVTATMSMSQMPSHPNPTAANQRHGPSVAPPQMPVDAGGPE